MIPNPVFRAHITLVGSETFFIADATLPTIKWTRFEIEAKLLQKDEVIAIDNAFRKSEPSALDILSTAPELKGCLFDFETTLWFVDADYLHENIPARYYTRRQLKTQ